MRTAVLERDQLLEDLTRLHAEGGRLAFVEAEAGGGKTTLIREFTRRAEVTAAVGRCEELESPAPLGPLRELARVVGGAFAAAIDAGRSACELAPVLLDELREPWLVVLEDLQWADEATLDVLRELAGGVGATPSLVLTTYRGDELDGAHPLRQLLAELAAAPAVEYLTLPPLSPAAVCELAAPQGVDGAAIHALTHGNPLHVTELLGVLQKMLAAPRSHGSTRLTHHADMLVAGAAEQQATGDYEPAVAALRQAVALRQALGDPRRAGEHLAQLTMPYMGLGRGDEAMAALEEAIAMLRTLPESPGLATAYAFRAYARLMQRDGPEAVASGQRAVALARRFGADDTLALALTMTAAGKVISGEIDQGIELVEQSLAVSRACEDDTQTANTLLLIGTGLPEFCELALAERYLREHIEFASARRMDTTWARSGLAAVLVSRGRWSDGAALALEVLAQTSATVPRINAAIALGRVRARRGDPGARETLDQAAALVRRSGQLWRLAHVQAARAELAWLIGNPGGAAAEAGEAWPRVAAARHPWFGGELAYWLWRAGEQQRAPGWAAAPWAGQIAGRPIAAAEAWEQRGCPYEAARARAEADDPAAIRAGLEVLEALGARPAVREVRERLRAAGERIPRRPRASTREHPAGLTARELEVLRLLAGGLRNADIARALVVSPKTVEHHVGSIMRKLGARTRGEAVARAAALDAPAAVPTSG